MERKVTMLAVFTANIDTKITRAALFRLEPPHKGNDYVIVSIHNDQPNDTVIFPANKDGAIAPRAIVHHAKPKYGSAQRFQSSLREIGYEIVCPVDDEVLIDYRAQVEAIKDFNKWKVKNGWL